MFLAFGYSEEGSYEHHCRSVTNTLFLSIYLGVELLDHRLDMYLTLLEIPWSFPKSLYCYTLHICNISEF